VFVKFQIRNNSKQNINETHSKQPKIHGEIHARLWIIKHSWEKSANQKFQDFCQMFEISKKKTIPYAKDLKSFENLQPSPWSFILCDFHL
jgi:hypothetical protein